MPSLTRRCWAELVGAFALVFASTGAIIFDSMSEGELGNLGIGIVFGLAIAVMVYATRHVSGAHFNPAISLALAAVGRFPVAHVPAYWAAQIARATFASAVLRVLFGNVEQLGATLPAVAAGEAVAVEVIITAIPAFVIASVAVKGDLSRAGAAAAIGEAVSLGSILAGPLPGSCSGRSHIRGSLGLLGRPDGRCPFRGSYRSMDGARMSGEPPRTPAPSRAADVDLV